MAFFYSFTESLRQKWLQFFQANRDWVMLHMQVESVYTPDGGKRPPSYLILGVANALEPKLAQLMLPFSKLNPDADTLIEVLGLHFDPDMALGNSVMPKADDSEMIMGEDSTQTNSFNHGAEVSNFTTGTASAEEMMASASAAMAMEEMPMNSIAAPESDSQMGDISGFGEENLQSMSSSDDAFGDDISFNAGATAQQKMEYHALEDINMSEEDNSFDVIKDVWGDETHAQKAGIDNDMSLGEEFGTGVFIDSEMADDSEIIDDSEIARLFPSA